MAIAEVPRARLRPIKQTQPDKELYAAMTRYLAETRLVPTPETRLSESSVPNPGPEYNPQLERPYPQGRQEGLLRLTAARTQFITPHWVSLKTVLGQVVPADQKMVKEKRQVLALQSGVLFADLIDDHLAKPRLSLPAHLTGADCQALEESIITAIAVAEDDHLLPPTGSCGSVKDQLKELAQEVGQVLKILYSEERMIPHQLNGQGEAVRGTDFTAVMTRSLWGDEVVAEASDLEALLETAQETVSPEAVREILISGLFSDKEVRRMAGDLPKGTLDGFNELAESQRRGLASLGVDLRSKLSFVEAIADIQQSLKSPSDFDLPDWSRLDLNAKAALRLIANHQQRLLAKGNSNGDLQLEALLRFQKRIGCLIEELSFALNPPAVLVKEDEIDVNPKTTIGINERQHQRLRQEGLGLTEEDRLTALTQLSKLTWPCGVEKIRYPIDRIELNYETRVEVAPHLLDYPLNREPRLLVAQVVTRLRTYTACLQLAAGREIPPDNVPEAMRRALTVLGASGFDPNRHAQWALAKVVSTSTFFPIENDNGINGKTTQGKILATAAEVAGKQGALEAYQGLVTPDKAATAFACGLTAQCLAAMKAIPQPEREKKENEYAGLLMGGIPSLSELALVADYAWRRGDVPVDWRRFSDPGRLDFTRTDLERRALPSWDKLDQKLAPIFPDEKSRRAILDYCLAAAGKIRQSYGLETLDERDKQIRPSVLLISGGPGVGKSTILNTIWGMILEQRFGDQFGREISGGFVDYDMTAASITGYIGEQKDAPYRLVLDTVYDRLTEQRGYVPTLEEVKSEAESGRWGLHLGEAGKRIISVPGERETEGYSVPGTQLQQQMLFQLTSEGTIRVERYLDRRTGNLVDVTLHTGRMPHALSDTWERSLLAEKVEKAKRSQLVAGEKSEVVEKAYLKLPVEKEELAKRTGLTRQFARRVTHVATLMPPTPEMAIQVLTTPYDPADPDFNPLNPLSRAMLGFGERLGLHADPRQVIVERGVEGRMNELARRDYGTMGWSALHDQVVPAMVDHFGRVWNLGDPGGRGGLGLNQDGNLVITPDFVSQAMAVALRR